jgi:hypothetical protein
MNLRLSITGPGEPVSVAASLGPEGAHVWYIRLKGNEYRIAAVVEADVRSLDLLVAEHRYLAERLAAGTITQEAAIAFLNERGHPPASVKPGEGES